MAMLNFDFELNFDPSKMVNSQSEHEHFDRLLNFSDDKRILLIQDQRNGYGKTSLLMRFRHHCRTVRNVPVCIVNLDHEQLPTSYALVNRIVEELSGYIAFEEYEKVNEAIKAENFAAIQLLSRYLDHLPSLLGYVSIGSVDNAPNFQAMGTQINIHSVSEADLEILLGLYKPSPLTESQRHFAHEIAIKAFFSDLSKYLKSGARLVLLFDAYEKAQAALIQWMMHQLFAPSFFRAPELTGMAVVIAGHSVPQFRHEFPEPDCARLIVEINGLTDWDEEDIGEALIKYNRRNTKERRKLLLKAMKDLQATPLDIIQIIKRSKSEKQ